MGGSQSKRKLVPNRPLTRPQIAEEAPPTSTRPRPVRPTPKASGSGRGGSPKPKMVPPDGGWGWMVVFGTALTVFFFPAMTVAFGVLFSDRLEEMGAGKTEFTIIGNLLSSVWSFVALLMAPITELFGYRSVTIVGGLLSFKTMLLSAYCTNLTSFTFSYSVLGGIAGSLSTFNGFAIIPQYFQKRKGLANGIVASCSALGKIAMAPLLRLLLDVYGYTWACLIVGALSLHTCFAGMLYHPPEWHLVPQKDQDPEIDAPLPMPGSLSSTDVVISENGIVEEHRHGQQPQPQRQGERKRNSTPGARSIEEEEEEEENVLFVMPATAASATAPPSGPRRDDEVVLFSRQTSKAATAKGVSDSGLRKVDSAMCLGSSIPMLIPIDNKVYQEDQGHGKKSCCDDFVVVKVFTMLKYSLLKDPYFHLVAWPNALCLTAYVNSMYALPGYVKSLGYTPYQSAFAISVFSVSEAVLRLTIAVLSDMNWFPIEAAYTAGFIFAALSTGLLPLIPSYEWILTCQVFNGLAMSLASVLFIHVALKYHPVENYAQVIGFCSIFNGISLFFLGSVIGFVADKLGHNGAYYLIGSIAAVAAGIWIVRLVCTFRKDYKSVPAPSQ
ncbi:monocarboxylate transporter 9-like [Penaeus chinensis]|uniref:monocarboxylate transporter 9-like n=1 Tax=Penaeus chinensis TaxID=139456 RepID=UPI001FB769CE|nr:monocarboxylate transporter 9-like [Penaeus chinensis]